MPAAIALSLSANAATQGSSEPPTDPIVPTMQSPLGDAANFNPEVVRGMTIVNDKLYAVNSYESSVKIFDFTSTDTVIPFTGSFRTVHNPVSIASKGNNLYVIGAGTHGLAVHDRFSGNVMGYVTLPSEPADLVIDGDTAWVTCMGEDCVAEIDISGNGASLLRVHNHKGDGDPLTSDDGSLRLKRPRHLFLDTQRGQLFIAPFTTGNGSTTFRKKVKTGTGWPGRTETLTSLSLAPEDTAVLIDGHDASGLIGHQSHVSEYPNSILPDEDLFTLQLSHPPASTSDPQERVRPIARKITTLAMGHGRNAVTGDYWILGIESKNLSFPSETAANGQFAENELEIIRGGTTSSTLPAANEDDVVESDDRFLLDDSPGNEIAFPWSLDFNTTSGLGAISGSNSARVQVRSSTGASVVGTLDLLNTGLPGSLTGRVPRTVMWVGDDLLVYCQEDDRILLYEGITPTGVFPVVASHSFELGNDPTPEIVEQGREIWYDARNSEQFNLTCNTCHPGGETDGLAWALSNEHVDVKDPMFTQSLRGIDDSFPYHWRGERDLIDFNEAFPGLLGHTAKLPAQPTEGLNDYLALEQFIFSMQAPANPRAKLERHLPVADPLFDSEEDDLEEDLASLVASPARGFEIYTNGTMQVNCNLCHALPTGSNGHVVVDNNTLPDSHANFHVSGNKWMERVQIEHVLTFKQQPLIDFKLTGDGSGQLKTFDYRLPLLGFGLRHNGVNRSIEDFLVDQFASVVGSGSNLDAQDLADLTSFLEQVDSGTPPAAHHAVYVSSDSDVAAALNEVQTVLVGQSARSWIDVVVFGLSADAGGAMIRQSWLYDRDLNKFVSNGFSTGQQVDLDHFDPMVNPGSRNLFLGCIKGQGQRLGLDIDDDEVLDFEDFTPPTTPAPPFKLSAWNPDSDGDGDKDGYELVAGHNGDPTDPGIVASDGIDPIMLNADNSGTTPTTAPVFVGARQLKFPIEANEEVRWSLTLLDGSNQIYREASQTYARSHTAMIHGLRPALDSNNPLTYRGVINLWDHEDNMEAIAIPTFSMPTFGTAQPSGAGVVVDDLVWSQAPSLNSSMNKEGGVRFKTIADSNAQIENAPHSTDTGLGKFYPALSLVRRQSSASDWENVPLTDIVQSGTTIFNDAPNYGQLLLGDSMSSVPLAVSGMLEPPFFVLDPDTQGSGSDWEFAFEVSGVSATYELGVVVVAVHQRDSTWTDRTLFMPPTGGVSIYVLPLTAPEDRFIHE